eukprot:s777_g22.t1
MGLYPPGYLHDARNDGLHRVKRAHHLHDVKFSIGSLTYFSVETCQEWQMPRRSEYRSPKSRRPLEGFGGRVKPGVYRQPEAKPAGGSETTTSKLQPQIDIATTSPGFLPVEGTSEKFPAELTQLSSQPAPTEEEAATLRAQAAMERKKCEQLRSEIQAYERCGPAKLAEMKKQTAIAKEAANRWADNICAVRSLFLRERRGEISASQFDQTFGLPEEFEYLE